VNETRKRLRTDEITRLLTVGDLTVRSWLFTSKPKGIKASGDRENVVTAQDWEQLKVAFHLIDVFTETNANESVLREA
jgi:hypothetical protein